jgi:uncharacterized protein with HEPN domain
MSDTPEREWRFFIDDMLEAGAKVVVYTDGVDQAAVVARGLNYDATVRNLEIMGEAATHVPDAVRDGYPEIPWRQIVAMRNRLIHGYLGIDDDTLWSIIEDDVPVLLVSLAQLKAGLR